MTSALTGHITATEWRWVIRVAVGIVSLVFAPFLWVLLAGIPDSSWQFMGALHDYGDSALHLALVTQGADSGWLTRLLFTPEPTSGTLLGAFYALLGQIARLTALSPIAIFHVARLGAALAMVLALYHLAATIWMRVRTRRLFFVFSLLGGGFGWLLTPLTGNESYLDLAAPQAFPFYAMLVNVHMPLAIACLAISASVIVPIFRPDDNSAPTVDNGGLVVFLMGLFLIFIYPLALLPISLAFILRVALHARRRTEPLYPKLQWLLWYIVPALPVAVYYLLVIRYDPITRLVWMQTPASPPALPVLLLSFGLPLLIALPGLWRAVRRFEPDGDQFMLIWLALILLLIYFPGGFYLHFIVGITIPLMYFATRSIEDFWLEYINRRWRLRVMMALIPLMAASFLLLLVLPVRAVTSDNRGAAGMLLQRDYADAFGYMRQLVRTHDVVLAAPDVSLWLPAWTGAQVVYGHPQRVAEGSSKRQAVYEWFRATDTADCQPLLDGIPSYNQPYHVNYVIYGPREAHIGQTVCLDDLRLLRRFGEVAVYAADR